MNVQLNPVKICDFDLGSTPPSTPNRSSRTSNGYNSPVPTLTSDGNDVNETSDGSGSVHYTSASEVGLDDSCASPKFLTPVGSLEWMAPEVLLTWIGESRVYNKKCDCWSLGIALYIASHV